MDLTNPVLAAVNRGIEAERAGDVNAAREAYDEAWTKARDDYEQCVAAHYVPRLIDDMAEKLRWNQIALECADSVGDERVEGFYASLHANVGFCLEGLRDEDGARSAYQRAKECLTNVPAGPYREQVEATIEGALDRLRACSE